MKKFNLMTLCTALFLLVPSMSSFAEPDPDRYVFYSEDNVTFDCGLGNELAYCEQDISGILYTNLTNFCQDMYDQLNAGSEGWYNPSYKEKHLLKATRTTGAQDTPRYDLTVNIQCTAYCRATGPEGCRAFAQG